MKIILDVDIEVNNIITCLSTIIIVMFVAETENAIPLTSTRGWLIDGVVLNVVAFSSVEAVATAFLDDGRRSLLVDARRTKFDANSAVARQLARVNVLNSDTFTGIGLFHTATAELITTPLAVERRSETITLVRNGVTESS